MAEESEEERSLEPTERRLEQARERGEFPQSRDLSFLLILAAGALLVWSIGDRIAAATLRLVTDAMRSLATQTPEAALERWAQEALLEFGLWALLCAVVAAAAGLLGPLLLVRFRPVFAPRFDWSRVDPVAGLGRMVSLQNLFQLGKGVLVTVIVGALCVLLFVLLVGDLAMPAGLAPGTAIAALGHTLARFALFLFAAVAVIALADAAFQWFSFMRRMRMTRQEMKDEMKESEGSPEIRQRIRMLQREAARRRMMAAVEKADVVVTNPTHFAVALQYERTRMNAPRVIAKGEDEVALRIRGIAGDARIPVAESPALARWLHRHVEIGHPVPSDLYEAVARLLAWAYDEREGRPTRRPDLDVHVPWESRERPGSGAYEGSAGSSSRQG